MDGIKHHGIIMPLDKKFEIMELAHCFVIPSSFNPNKHEDYKYSFPTKLPELIACGSSHFILWPCRYLSESTAKSAQIGIRIHNRSVDDLISTMMS